MQKYEGKIVEYSNISKMKLIYLNETHFRFYYFIINRIYIYIFE